jgi:hypothetical protein
MSAQCEFDFDRPSAAERAPQDIAEKIKKLLRLGKSANRHEAELALERAFRLAQKYRVDLESLDLDQESEKLAHEWFGFGKRASFLACRALNVVVHFFRVEVCISFPRVVFVGRATDVMIAGYAFEFIVRAGKMELREFEKFERKARRKMSTGKRKQFIQGFIYGITVQLTAAEDEIVLDDSKTAMIVAEKARRERYINELIPNQEKKKLDTGRMNRTALTSGFLRGKETRINTPLHNSSEATLLLT